jgi:hypothetical protein
MTRRTFRKPPKSCANGFLRGEDTGHMADTMACDGGCGGTGLVRHTKRQVGTGTSMVDDPTDRQLYDLCSKCSGSGRLPYKPPRNLEERPRGFIADQTEFG